MKTKYNNILVTGGHGLIGSAIRDVGLKNATFLSSKDCDLTNIKDVERLFFLNSFDAVIHLAGKVGGVKSNMTYPATFFEDNIVINYNVIKCARMFGVERVVSALSTCIFPDKTEYPLKEEYLHNGPPHNSNYAYAHAKRMIEVQSRAYREQYGLNYTCVVPTNVYGPHDNYHSQDSHVIPGLIRRAHECNESGYDFTIWGSGKPQRDFIFSHDMARLIIRVLDEYNDPEPINLATGIEVSINDVANMIISHYPNIKEVKHDISGPEGQFKKPVDITKLKSVFGDFKLTSLEDGIRHSVEWYNSNYPNVRGI